MPQTLSEDAFRAAWEQAKGSPALVAKITGLGIGSVYQRRARLAAKGIVLASVPQNRQGEGPDKKDFGWQLKSTADWPKRRELQVKDGIVIVGGDAHYWPGRVTCAHLAFVKLAKKLEPKAIIQNGDAFDGATISRHPPLRSDEKKPTVLQELETVSERLGEIEKAAPNADLFYTAGNHDSRYDRYLATHAPQFGGVPGAALSDFFPRWRFSYSVMVNEGTHPVMVKHAWRGGIHAVWNNTVHAGVSIVTNHLHAQLVRPFTDYRGTRYGVDTGTLADIDGPQFDYVMDNPVNWRSGFAVLTFRDGTLLPPELCEVQYSKDKATAYFRGQAVAEVPRE